MPDVVPFLDLPAQHAPIAQELVAAFSDAVSTAGFIGGKKVDAFEANYAAFCGTKGCVGVANGTDALTLSLRALGVGPDDVVLLPSFTFIATAEAVTLVGATPRFVEIDPATYTMDPTALAAVDHSGVKAVIPVHLYGQAADMDAISSLAKDKGWAVIEDAAQAHGAQYKGRPVGSMGDLACFSFYPGKNLGALGDGGAVVGNDLDRLAHLRRLSDHGRITKYEHGEPGYNSRLDAIQAAALDIKLRHLGDWNAARARAAAWYDARFEGSDSIVRPVCGAERTHVYHLYVIQSDERDRLRDHLGTHNVQSGVHYQLPLHLQPAYRSLGYEQGALKISESVSERCLSLPMFPGMTEAQVDRVTSAVAEFKKAGS